MKSFRYLKECSGNDAKNNMKYQEIGTYLLSIGMNWSELIALKVFRLGLHGF